MTVLISFNKDLFLTLLLATVVIQGLLYVGAGIFLNGKEKGNTWGGDDVLAGCLNLAIAIIALIA